MFQSLMATQPREWAKWCVYALVLLTPGSFVIVPLYCLVRHGMQRAARLKVNPGPGFAGTPKNMA